ncbi:hypothetical protein MMC13_002687 [Lambiella insularis]|nr:hypothetical protein [Lambiella insularis]
MTTLTYYGSTCIFYRVRPGVVLKSPVQVWEKSLHRKKLSEEIAHSFFVERQIFEMLGQHPRIVKYLGYQDAMDMRHEGLLLAEASHGNLQAYLDKNYDCLDFPLRRKWCQQATQSIAYLHKNGVIHSDLRPENFLVHATTTTSLDLWLCDFGGSMCKEMDLDGGHLPDDPFYDPTLGFVSIPATDIFSLGSILYTILTGHWPYKSPGPFDTPEEMYKYQSMVNALFGQGQFPNVTELTGGKVVMGCWTKRYSTAEEILQAIEVEIPLKDNDI